MSAPADKTHDKIRTAHQNVLKFKKEGEMKMAKQITKVRRVITWGMATRHPVKLVGILALGALLTAGTAVHFAPESDSGPVNRSSVEKVQESPGFTDVESVEVSRINESSGETLRIREQLRAADRQEDYQEMVRYWDRLKRDAEVGAPAKAPANNVDTEYRFMDVEDELSVEDLLTYVYPEEATGMRSQSLYPDTEYYRDPDWREGQTANENIPAFDINQGDPKLLQDVTAFFGEDVVAALGYEVLTARLNQYQADGELTSRDIEHLDDEIDMMLVAAASKSSAARAAYNRQVERLEEKISSLLAEASRNPSTNMLQLNREIDRLDDQINMLQLAALQKQ